jgi:uncharacterized protein (DUF1697 family)
VTVQIALLRAINLGAHNKVAMSDLRALLTNLGFDDVRSLLQTGNLVFRSDTSAAKVERQLEAEAEKRLGLKTEFMVRTAAEWHKIVTRNPFPEEAKRDPAHLILMVCKEAPGKSLKVAGAKREVVRAVGREIYIVYPDGIGRSRLKINTLGTGRNWNTVLKLDALARE